MKTLLRVLLMLFLIYCMPLVLHAQLEGPGDDPDAPIDGGISILLAAGIGYGVKKGYEKKQKAKTNDVLEK